MKIIHVEQGSPEWINARLGMPTASNFDKILTPKTLKPSSSQDRYLARLAAEWFLEQPLDDYVSPFMERGIQLEDSAVSFYEFDQGVDTEKVGLCVRDDGKSGASPDRLVCDDGTLEIKCPSIEVHMSYLLNSGLLVADYWSQVQGEMWVAERKWCDLMSYSPILPEVRVRVMRDENFIAALAENVAAFVVKLDAAKERLAPLKLSRPARRVVERDSDPFATTEATEGAFL